MALTAYDSQTSPTMAADDKGNVVPIVGRVNGTASATCTSVRLGIPAQPSWIPIIRPNDYIVCVIDIYNNAATVSSIALAGVSGLAFTRLQHQAMGTSQQEVWIAQYTGSTTIVTGGVWTVTLSASIATWCFAGTVIHNASSFSYDTINSTGHNAASTPSFGYTALPTPTKRNNLALQIAGAAAAWVTTVAFFVNAAPDVEPWGGNTTSAQDAGAQVKITSTIQPLSVPGIGISVTGTGTLTGSALAFDWAIYGMVFYGPAVSLDDLTFMLGDNGTLLNSSTSVPFFDVTQIQGLSDIGTELDSSEIDGADGSYVQGKYASGKTVVVDGILYATPPVDEGIIDTMKTSAAPTQRPVPFYYKLPTKNLRVLTAYPGGFKSDFDRGRSLGQIPFELQMSSPDAVAYEQSSVAQLLAPTSGTTFSLIIDTSGNKETLPDLYFSIGLAELAVSPIQFFSPTWVTALTESQGPTQGWTSFLSSLIEISNVAGATPTDIPGRLQTMKLSLRDRSLTMIIDGALWDISGFITKRSWFSLLPNQRNVITMVRPTATTNNTGLVAVYRNAWA